MSKIKSSNGKGNLERFQIILNKPDGTFETLLYQKQNEKFNQEGYAVVRAYSKDKRYANCTWYGVVNENFQTLIPFRLWDRIDLHLGNQVIAQESSYQKGMLYPFVRTYHYSILDSSVELVRIFGKSKKIGESLLLIEDEYDNVQRQFLYALYDVGLKKVVSNSFHQIGESIERDGKMFFPAKRELVNHNMFLHSLSVFCYIDEKGNIVSSVYNPIEDRYEEVTRDNFSQYIDSLENRNPVHRSSQEVFLTLEKTILRKKKKSS